jgi:hypothetical protein
MTAVRDGIENGVYREVMAPAHGEIVKQLGDGWAVAWDATVVDSKTRRAMDEAVKASTDALREAIGVVVPERDAGSRPARRRRVAKRAA